MNVIRTSQAALDKVALNKIVVQAQNLIQVRDERGAAMAEYGLLLALVALVVMGVALTLGSSIKSTFVYGNEAFDNAPGAANGNPSTN